MFLWCRAFHCRRRRLTSWTICLSMQLWNLLPALSKVSTSSFANGSRHCRSRQAKRVSKQEYLQCKHSDRCRRSFTGKETHVQPSHHAVVILSYMHVPGNWQLQLQMKRSTVLCHECATQSCRLDRSEFWAERNTDLIHTITKSERWAGIYEEAPGNESATGGLAGLAINCTCAALYMVST